MNSNSLVRRICVRPFFALIAVTAMAAGAVLAIGPAAAGADESAATHVLRLPGQNGRVETIRVESAALEEARLPVRPVRDVRVYLPPSYESEPGRRFPVIYLLHGYGVQPPQWLWLFEREVITDRLFAQGLAEMIIVMPDAVTALGGGFYTDSPSHGGWETFVTRDLVAAIDNRFRTLAVPESRGIAGHSMGGFGALRTAFRHPDIFSAVYALSPCCLGPHESYGMTPELAETLARLDSLEAAAATEDFEVLATLALAASWSPNLDKPPFFADVPAPVSGPDGETGPVAARWREAMVLPRMDDYAAGARDLKAIGFDTGLQDGFEHIPPTLRQLHEDLNRRGIAHDYETYEGDHNNRIPERIVTHMLPFMAAHLAAE